MIIGTLEGTEINLRLVLEAVPEGETMLLTLVGGEKRTASFSAWYSALALISRQIIPAHEGTYALYPCAEVRPRGFHKEKVIAWGIDSLRYVQPITVGDAPDGIAGPVPAVLHSDGSVAGEGAVFPSLEHWLDFIHTAEEAVADDDVPGSRVIH